MLNVALQQHQQHQHQIALQTLLLSTIDFNDIKNNSYIIVKKCQQDTKLKIKQVVIT